MKRKNSSIHQSPDGGPLVERREFERIELPAAAFAYDLDGNELGRVVETGGGGLLLSPSSPLARVFLTKGQQFVLTVVEPATGNETNMAVEVRHIDSNNIGLRFR